MYYDDFNERRISGLTAEFLVPYSIYVKVINILKLDVVIRTTRRFQLDKYKRPTTLR